MKKIILFLITVIIFISCQDPWATYPYTTFDQAIEEITNEYGDPAVVKDTVFYDDGTVRNRVAYWDIDPPEYYGDNHIGQPQYYTTISAEIWNQPYNDKNSLVRYRQYGWELLRLTKGNADYLE